MVNWNKRAGIAILLGVCLIVAGGVVYVLAHGREAAQPPAAQSRVTAQAGGLWDRLMGSIKALTPEEQKVAEAQQKSLWSRVFAPLRRAGARLQSDIQRTSQSPSWLFEGDEHPIWLRPFHRLLEKWRASQLQSIELKLPLGVHIRLPLRGDLTTS